MYNFVNISHFAIMLKIQTKTYDSFEKINIYSYKLKRLALCESQHIPSSYFSYVTLKK